MNRSFLMTAVVALAGLAATNQADAGYRQYYGGYTYYPSRSYYVQPYYYKPTPSYSGYRYHYCVHYPSQPRYVYYYNPYTSQYWGRFDLEGKEGAQYSLLKEEDRKGTLKEIDEKAFPKPGAMPTLPEAEDAVAMDPQPKLDLPDPKEAAKAADNLPE